MPFISYTSTIGFKLFITNPPIPNRVLKNDTGRDSVRLIIDRIMSRM